MAKKKDQQAGAAALLETLGDFTSKENWDNFFRIRGSDDSFEWYAEWPHLKAPLLSALAAPHDHSSEAGSPPPPQILVPGCGNSRLSEHLYDAGFRGITNIDFSKIAITNMLGRNVRDRPHMRWRVMDMTAMQFKEGTFDAVIDKGGLDALVEPELGPKLGSQYLSEVKRVLKLGGKFICLTLGELPVLGLLFSKFRFGWKMNIQAISQKPSKQNKFQTFMLVAEKDTSTVCHQIMTSFNHSSLDCDSKQASGLHEALEKENGVRGGFACDSHISYSLEDLKCGAKGDLRELIQGRRVQFTMGEDWSSCFSYKAILLDAHGRFGPFKYQCGVFLVPKSRAHEWLFSSEEGQWMIVENSKSARLIMVFLDTSHTNSLMDDIQKDLSPLIKPLAPERDVNDALIPFMMASDGVKHRKIVHQVTSTLTGPMVVEDVIYENLDGEINPSLASKDLEFRRLTFQRSKGLVQPEALLLRKGSSVKVDETERRESISSSKPKKRLNKRRSASHPSPLTELSSNVEVDHSYLASSYHTGIISGFMLISAYLDSVLLSGGTVKVAVIGLGAGLLPMFLHRCMPFLQIEVVELDPKVSKVATDYFGFREDRQLKVHIADGIRFVREAANFQTSLVPHSKENADDLIGRISLSSDERCSASHTEDTKTRKFDILVIDVDSSDSRSGLTCPAAEFVESSFLLTVKDVLSVQGLFVINLVSRSPAIKDMVISRVKLVFSHLFCLQLEEDVNEVIFALNADDCIKEDEFSEATARLAKLLKLGNPDRSEGIIGAIKKIMCLK